jgi:hypothetical protein
VEMEQTTSYAYTVMSVSRCERTPEPCTVSSGVRTSASWSYAVRSGQDHHGSTSESEHRGDRTTGPQLRTRRGGQAPAISRSRPRPLHELDAAVERAHRADLLGVSPSTLEGVVDQVRTTLITLVAEFNANMPDGAAIPSVEVADNAFTLAIMGKRYTVTVAAPQGGSTMTSTAPEEPAGGCGSPAQFFLDWSRSSGWSSPSYRHRAGDSEH